jgi:hypothetical protein
MGKQRRKFETGFKQQIVQEVESGLLSVSAASRKYQIAGIQRGLRGTPFLSFSVWTQNVFVR